MLINLKRYIERYIVTAIVLFFSKISLPVSEKLFHIAIYRFWLAIYLSCLAIYRSCLAIYRSLLAIYLTHVTIQYCAKVMQANFDKIPAFLGFRRNFM